MKRTNKNLVSILPLTIGLSLLATGCSGNKTQFKEVPSVWNPSSTTDPGNVTETEPGRFEFTKAVIPGETSPLPLDMVWVIDNSASMEEEAAHVSKNFEAFLENVSHRTDLKVALISTPSGKYGVRMPSQSPSRLQIEREVDSYNSLQLVSWALCGSATTDCRSRNIGGATQIEGSLRSFLRPDSKKVIIVVSDDQSRIAPAQFTSEFSASYPGQTPTLFAFVGLGKNLSACQYATGQHYISLADQTGGKVYNICEPDWRDHFDDLAQKVVDISVPSIPFAHAKRAIRVIQILLDGVPLRETEYSIDAKGIRLHKSLFANGQPRTLKFVYELK